MPLTELNLQIFDVNEWKDLNPQGVLAPNTVHLWRVKDVPPKGRGSLEACDPLFKHYFGENYLIQRNENGKPLAYREAMTLHDIQFNISHTKNIFVIAFIASHFIGIDVEERDMKRPWKSLAKRFFAPEEVAQLNAADETQKLDLFFQFWTLKEAMIKCLGISIFTGISQAHFSIETDQIKLLAPLQNEPSLRFFHHRDSHYFSMAITTRA